MAAVMNTNLSDVISAESRAEIDKWIAKYPADQKQYLQEMVGFVPHPTLRAQDIVFGEVDR